MGKYFFIFIVFVVIFSLTLNPLQSESSVEFDWMFMFGLALFSGVGALYGLAGMVIVFVEEYRRSQKVKQVNSPPVVKLPPPASMDVRRATGEMERSEFGKQRKERRCLTYEEDNAVKYAEGGQTTNRLRLPLEGKKQELWGFKNISESRNK